MPRLLMACLLALASVFALAGPTHAVPRDDVQQVAVQPADTVSPGPDLTPSQQTDPAQQAETKRKLWIGAIALVMFVLVYYRNKRRWSKWRKRRAAAKAAEG